MFDVILEVDPAIEILRRVRNAVEAIAEPVREAVKGPIREHVEQDVERLLAPYPERSDTSFTFATPKSRRFYLMARRKGLFGSQLGNTDGPWIRTGTLHDSWQVVLDPATTRVNTVLRIENNASYDAGNFYSAAVIGTEPVQGFVDIGWGATFDDAVAQITEGVEYDLVTALQEAIWNYKTT